jgi:hypothetical protein
MSVELALVLVLLASGGIGALWVLEKLPAGPPRPRYPRWVQFGHHAGFWGGRGSAFQVPYATRLRHLVVHGPTGSGKSYTLRQLVLQDTTGGFGCVLVDIKDTMCLEMAALLPKERVGDALLFDPTDTEFPPAFNPLAEVTPGERTIAAAEMLSALRRLFGEDGWGPRLEYILRFCLLTLLETPEATLLDIRRLLTDEEFRSWAVGQLDNFSVCEFWEQEWPSIAKGGSTANVASILNKLGVFSYPEVRNVLGQARRGLDIDAAVKNGAIVLVHLPQGVLGEDASSFLAALLVGRVQLAAQRRVRLPEHQRIPFFLFADEFQNYKTSAFDKLITEGRSMGVGVVAACQYAEQLDRPLRLALEKNCAYQLTCKYYQGVRQVEVFDLQAPEPQTGWPDYRRVTLLPLRPPARTHPAQLGVIRTQSRQRLGHPRADVEREIVERFKRRRTSSDGASGRKRTDQDQDHEQAGARGESYRPFE